MKINKNNPFFSARRLAVALAAAMLAAPLTSLEAATILEHGLNNTATPDSVDLNLTYTTLTGPGGAYVTANTEGTHSVRWLASQVTNSNNPGVANIMFSFSLAPVSGATTDLDATNTVTWDILAGTASSANGGITTYSKLFIASDADFTDILASSSVFSLSADRNQTTLTTPFLNYDDGLGSTATLYFGFAFGDTSGVTNKWQGLDNIQVNGMTVGMTVIPEPTTALAGLLLAAGLLRRRRTA